jgi:predicted CXXCH cytochrome family protein
MYRRAALALSFLPLILVALLACTPRTKSAEAPVPDPVALNGFLGNESCKECHAAEFAEHGKSRHAHTLRFVTTEDMGEYMPPLGPVGETSSLLEESDGRFLYGPPRTMRLPLDIAFGSGKSGMAFASILPGEVLAEARMSWFTPQKRWFETPGQRGLPPQAPGNLMRGPAARQCVGCHVVTLAKGELMPEKRFLGVGCESCHGPGAEHVQVMREGGKGGVMAKLAKISAIELNERCGVCHRTEEAVTREKLDRTKTDLFQSYGLARSSCFQKGKTLSCMSCHSAHGDAEPGPERYEKVCLSCHAAPKKACPVNATAKCIGCHMPARPEPLFDGSPRKMTDHYIRIWTEAEKKRLSGHTSDHR